MKGVITIALLFSTIYMWSQVIEDEVTVVDSVYYENQDYDEYNDGVKTGSWGMMFMDFKLDIPQKINGNSFNSNLFGLDLGVFKQFKENSSFHLGGGLSMVFYGDKSFTYFDYSPEDGYEYQYQQDFTGSILNIYVGSKYFSPKSYWIFNPYMSFDLEYRYTFGYVNNTNLDLDYIQSTDFQDDDYGLGYNVGIGSLIFVNNDNFFIDLSANFKTGGGLFLYQENLKNTMINSVLDYYDYKFFQIGFLAFKLGFVYRG